MRNIANSQVRRPVMYFVIATFAVALALPMAIASGQTQVGGMFDECYSGCDTRTLLAKLPN